MAKSFSRLNDCLFGDCHTLTSFGKESTALRNARLKLAAAPVQQMMDAATLHGPPK
jgi:hypothetical protein